MAFYRIKHPRPHLLRFIRSNRGMGLVSIISAVSAFLIIFMVTSNIFSNQLKQAQKTDQYLAANLVKQSLYDLFSSEPVIHRLFLNHTISDGPDVNKGPKNLGIRCIIDYKLGTRAFPCTHQKIPKVDFGTACDAMGGEGNKIMCWIDQNLANYQVDVLFHPDPAKSASTDLLIDNRTSTGGVSSQFEPCNEFSLVGGAGNGVSCPFRVRLYAWVECDGAAATCGATTGIGGTIKMAALVIPHGVIRPFNSLKYSILDYSIGRLL